MVCVTEPVPLGEAISARPSYLLGCGFVRQESGQQLEKLPDLVGKHPHGGVQDHPQTHLRLLSVCKEKYCDP